jgi:hypothetical protein
MPLPEYVPPFRADSAGSSELPAATEDGCRRPVPTGELFETPLRQQRVQHDHPGSEHPAVPSRPHA